MSKLIGIYVCAEAGLPMQIIGSVKATAGKGLIGDRYAKDRGTFSSRRKTRHITLIEFEAFAKINMPFEFSDSRRNLLTVGIRLNPLVGKYFQIGSVRMRGTELCAPCDRPSIISNKPGFEEFFKDRAGIRAEILNDGFLNIGDPIVIFDLTVVV